MSECPYCYSKIHIYATTCRYCTRSFELGFFVKLQRFVIRAFTVLAVLLIAVAVIFDNTNENGDENNSEDDISTTFQRNGLPATFESTADETEASSWVETQLEIARAKEAKEAKEAEETEETEEAISSEDRSRLRWPPVGENVQLDGYVNKIQKTILNKIVYPQQLKSQHTAKVEIMIWKDGNIRSRFISQKSTSNIWDKAVNKAIYSLDKFAPFPENISTADSKIFIVNIKSKKVN